MVLRCEIQDLIALRQGDMGLQGRRVPATALDSGVNADVLKDGVGEVTIEIASNGFTVATACLLQHDFSA